MYTGLKEQGCSGQVKCDATSIKMFVGNVALKLLVYLAIHLGESFGNLLGIKIDDDIGCRRITKGACLRKSDMVGKSISQILFKLGT